MCLSHGPNCGHRWSRGHLRKKKKRTSGKVWGPYYQEGWTREKQRVRRSSQPNQRSHPSYVNGSREAQRCTKKHPRGKHAFQTSGRQSTKPEKKPDTNIAGISLCSPLASYFLSPVLVVSKRLPMNMYRGERKRQV